MLSLILKSLAAVLLVDVPIVTKDGASKPLPVKCHSVRLSDRNCHLRNKEGCSI